MRYLHEKDVEKVNINLEIGGSNIKKFESDGDPLAVITSLSSLVISTIMSKYYTKQISREEALTIGNASKNALEKTLKEIENDKDEERNTRKLLIDLLDEIKKLI